MNQPVQPNDGFPGNMIWTSIEGRKQRTIEEILKVLDEEELDLSDSKRSAESRPVEILQVISFLSRLWHRES